MQIKKHSKLIKRIEEMKKKKEKKRKENYNTRYSQAVSHPSPDRARRCLLRCSDENRCIQRGMVVDDGLSKC